MVFSKNTKISLNTIPPKKLPARFDGVKKMFYIG